MFSNCCGSGRKQRSKTIKVRDVETQSDNVSLEDKETATAAIVDQPQNPTHTAETQTAYVTQSNVSTETTNNKHGVRIETTSEDDDVFSEGEAPPKLAQNLGTAQRPHVQLPKWFSQEDNEDDAEAGGSQEPPATPIGKDELSLRRHRFFSELISAAQNAAEHKVHFDPLGPVVSDAPSTNELDVIVTRLEGVTSRLERLETSCTNPGEINHNNILIATLTEEEITMSVAGYQDIIQGPLAQYLAVSQQIGGDVAAHSRLVNQAFQAQLQYIVTASQCKQPSDSEIQTLIQPTGKCLMEIQEFRDKNRGSPYFNHLSAISESIPALGWVAVKPAPAPYVKEMNDAGQFYTNRVLKDWKEKDKKHVDWTKAWVQTLTELQAFVKQHHTTGLVWGGKGAAPTGVPPPPPGGCPPPPPVLDFSTLEISDANNDRSALFAEINQGENITKSLKKVTADMQTHKNPTLRQGPAPFKAPTTGSALGQVKPPVDKPPTFVRDGKKWLIEYQKGNHNLLVDGAEMNNVVYLYKCENSTVTVKGKINSITLDSCKKTSVVFDSLVSAMEFINCQSVQMQVLGKVPTISIDKTDGCQMYLSNGSLDVEIVSSKSSEMNVLLPKGNGDYTEYPIPEQYKTTIQAGKGLQTVIVENKG